MKLPSFGPAGSFSKNQIKAAAARPAERQRPPTAKIEENGRSSSWEKSCACLLLLSLFFTFFRSVGIASYLYPPGGRRHLLHLSPSNSWLPYFLSRYDHGQTVVLPGFHSLSCWWLKVEVLLPAGTAEASRDVFLGFLHSSRVEVLDRVVNNGNHPRWGANCGGGANRAQQRNPRVPWLLLSLSWHFSDSRSITKREKSERRS